MNELNQLILEKRKLSYLINQRFTYEEYKILLFALEDQTRKYKHHELGRSFETLKTKLLENRKLFNE